VDVPARFYVDAGYMLENGLVQVDEDDAGYDLPEYVMSAVSLGGFFARCLLQTSFWEFGAPDYPDEDEPSDLSLDKLKVGLFRKKRVPQVHPLPVFDESLPAGSELELVRFPQKDFAGEPLLLIHGLAQGSLIYSAKQMSKNMARYFWKAGYDVWLLDYRLSNRLNLPFDGWSMDAIGAVDIPAAVSYVYEASARNPGDRRRPVKIFAHCVGAIGTQMAILGGRLKDENGDNQVESVCFNAIHPWTVPSAANLVRFKLGGLARSWVSDDILDPVIRAADQSSATRSALDRLAFAIARIREEPGEEWPEDQRPDEQHNSPHKFDSAICDRMTLLYGRMWRHQNLESSVKKNWDRFVGRGPDEVYEHLYYLIERERILDDQGQNVYLTEDNIAAHWMRIPTFFIHGDRSDVFNPQSATRSAVRLNRLLREQAGAGVDPAPVYLKRVPGYGHMDPILGREAHEDVYPDIDRFFRDAAAWHGGAGAGQGFDGYVDEDDPDPEGQFVPETGEILRAAWLDGGDVVSRYWVEDYRYNTREVEGVATFGEVPLTADPFRFRPDGLERWYNWVDQRTGTDYVAPRILVYRVGGRFFYVVVPDTFNPARLADFDPEIFAADPGSSSVSSSSPPTSPGSEAVALIEEKEDQPPWYRRLVRKQGMAQTDQFNFLVGSCRYPGTPIERTLADRVFQGMRRRVETDELDMVFFVGDQIYADAYADAFDSSVWRDRYYRSYSRAFNSKNLKLLLKSLPIHFAMDDHEIVDNYSGGFADGVTRPRTGRGAFDLQYAGINQDQVDFAHKAARSYMSSGREAAVVGGAAQPPPGTLWYAMDHDTEVNFPCFVMDTRSERALRSAYLHADEATLPPLVRTDENEQLDALLAWLNLAQNEAPDRPKFIMAGQILAPVTRSLVAHPSQFRNEDGILGYPGMVNALIDHIVTQGIQGVVFVGGDLHMSCAAEIVLSKQGYADVTAWQIVASGLYSPMPFANARPREYVWLSDDPAFQPVNLPLLGDRGFRFRAEWLSDVRSHFLQVTVEPGNPGWQISLQAFDRTGTALPHDGRSFDQNDAGVNVRFA
jgi:cholesterol oxidase